LAEDYVKFPLLELLPEDERREVLSGLKREKYNAGQVVYERGGPCMDVFFIFEGKIRVDVQDQNGEVAFFDNRFPGWFIGWFSAITDMPQPVTATAMEKRLLGRMLAAEFMEMILARRELSALMLRLMGERLVSDAKRISHLIVIDALRRVAAEVIERATVVGAVVELPERVDLAARLGMTRQTLATQLSELQRRGLIRIAGNRIQVLDAQQLADLVQ
jgi:CRP/FNR family transcriptional regulator, dissimilatory nitrate respiration regulator